MAEAANLLRHQTSPYLLQHADNPVHWRPWGQAALAEAAETDKPILLSIGYAACHWCHVMAHESFEDPDTAALMNTLFVSIKVDREERPDIDHLYMSALHGLGEQGGWPLTMFLAPDGAPFWGGTYFPPTPRWGRPSFSQVLQGVAAAWRERDTMVTQNTVALRRMLERQSAVQGGELPTPTHLDAVGAALLRITDPDQGGVKGAPKFPNPPIFRFLWQNAFRTGAPAGQDALHLLLQRMSQGGIYDHLGGGYARYATDAIWLVPHFEKMLYDNAQILELLAFAHAHRPDPLYAARAAETVGWMIRDMTAAEVDGRAAFAASEDADSEGEEGRFYVWTEAEVDLLLGTDAAAFKHAYDVTAEGNWEGHTILRRVTQSGSVAEETGLARCREVLFAARAKRVRPGRDDKVLADWNGLAIAALARAAVVFGHPEWLTRAEAAHDFILANMTAPDGRAQHAWRLGRVTAAGLLDDQAAMARAALALFEATGAARYLAEAARFADAALSFFADGQGGFYTSASDATDVPLARPRTAHDNATPAANGLLAEVFARLWHLTGDTAWREHAEALLRAFMGNHDHLAQMPTLLAAADLLEAGTTVVVVGPFVVSPPPLAGGGWGEGLVPGSDQSFSRADPSPHPPPARGGGESLLTLLTVAVAAPDPATIVLQVQATDALPPSHPAYGKGNDPAAFVCRGNVCSLPVADPVTLAEMLHGRAPPT
jgi:hypothetical protein